MSAELVAVPPVSLSPSWDPEHPPTRIYLQDLTYKLVAPRIPHPPVPHSVKIINNWVGPGARIAKNIWYALFPTGADTTVTGFLTSVADSVMNVVSTASLLQKISSLWSLQSVTVKDNGSGSGATGNSTHAPIPGTGVAPPLPPQTAVCLSWGIAFTYRGGKPRWYLPGLTTASQTPVGGSGIVPADAASIASQALVFLNTFNATPVATFTPRAGTVSYQSGHTARPTPLFYNFLSCEVHERLDSQRRRSGKESAFGEAP